MNFSAACSQFWIIFLYLKLDRWPSTVFSVKTTMNPKLLSTAIQCVIRTDGCCVPSYAPMCAPFVEHPATRRTPLNIVLRSPLSQWRMPLRQNHFDLPKATTISNKWRFNCGRSSGSFSNVYIISIYTWSTFKCSKMSDSLMRLARSFSLYFF